MRTCARALATGLVVAVGLVSVHACFRCDGWQPTEEIELGISDDLYAVTSLHRHFEGHYYLNLAVGEKGTVVAWGSDALDSRFVETMVVGDEDLRAVWADDWTGPPEVLVVGDGGMAAFSEDLGRTWAPIDLGTIADLHAILEIDDRLVVVGDEVVRVREADGTWTQPPTPTEGWGDLRGLAWQHQPDGTLIRVVSVGLGGTIWSTSDPGGAWLAEDSGVTMDLYGVASLHDSAQTIVAVGTGGAMLVRDSDGWTEVATGVDEDLVVAGGWVLGANGGLYELDPHSLDLEFIDTFPGARGFDGYGFIVGDDGYVARKQHLFCAL